MRTYKAIHCQAHCTCDGQTFWAVRYWRKDGFYLADSFWIIPGTLDLTK